MFSWICPQCGKEVPPSMTDCPDCAERAKQMAALGPPAGQPMAAAPWQPQQPPQQFPPPPPAAPWQQQPPTAWQQPAPQAAPPSPPPAWQSPQSIVNPPQAQPQWPATPPPAWQPPPPSIVNPPQPEVSAFNPAPPPQYPPPQQQYAPPHQHPQYAQQPPAAWPPPETRSRPPAWLVGVGTAAVFLLIGYGAYSYLNRGDSTAASASGDKPAAAAAAGGASNQKVTNPLQKYVEVVGIRMITENKQPAVKFLVVNHSGAEIVDLAASVTLMASTARSDEDPVGTFNFKVPSVGPNEFKETSAPLKTKLKPYEMPDWQNVVAQVDITSPQGQ